MEYDSGTIQLPAIKEAVTRIGYEVVEKSDTRQVTIPIGGMTCAACAARVEKAISKLEGSRAFRSTSRRKKRPWLLTTLSGCGFRLSGTRSGRRYKALEINSSSAADEGPGEKTAGDQDDVDKVHRLRGVRSASALYRDGADDKIRQAAVPRGRTTR